MIDPDACEPSPDVISRGEEYFMQYPRNSHVWRALSRCTVFSVGLISKIFVKGWHHTEVLNSETYYSVIKRARKENRGVITVMNHISILDDPLVWGGTLPLRILGSSKMRWTLGAKDIVFRTKGESNFFSLGQVLAVERFGKGPDQPAIDAAISLISKGKWVHLYPEGFVHQPYEPYTETLRYFHWGVSRLILESGPKMPIVLPIYGKGLSDVFPEDKAKKTFGYGANLPITYAFGEPIDPVKLGELRIKWQELKRELETTNDKQPIIEKMHQLRSETASFVREGVLRTKHQYFEKSEHDSDMRFNDPAFWKNQEIVRIKGKTVAEKLVKSRSN